MAGHAPNSPSGISAPRPLSSRGTAAFRPRLLFFFFLFLKSEPRPLTDTKKSVVFQFKPVRSLLRSLISLVHATPLDLLQPETSLRRAGPLPSPAFPPFAYSFVIVTNCTTKKNSDQGDGRRGPRPGLTSAVCIFDPARRFPNSGGTRTKEELLTETCFAIATFRVQELSS